MAEETATRDAKPNIANSLPRFPDFPAEVRVQIWKTVLAAKIEPTFIWDPYLTSYSNLPSLPRYRNLIEVRNDEVPIISEAETTRRQENARRLGNRQQLEDRRQSFCSFYRRAPSPSLPICPQDQAAPSPPSFYLHPGRCFAKNAPEALLLVNQEARHEVLISSDNILSLKKEGEEGATQSVYFDFEHDVLMLDRTQLQFLNQGSKTQHIDSIERVKNICLLHVSCRSCPPLSPSLAEIEWLGAITGFCIHELPRYSSAWDRFVRTMRSLDAFTGLENLYVEYPNWPRGCGGGDRRGVIDGWGELEQERYGGFDDEWSLARPRKRSLEFSRDQLNERRKEMGRSALKKVTLMKVERKA